MGEITEGTRRHYLGADADKDSIPAVVKDRGDSFHANDSKKQYYWNGTAWKTGLGYEYVPRAVEARDFETGAFTADGTWKVDGLDLSGIVPAGAVAVQLSIVVKDDAANSEFTVRKNATHDINDLFALTHVANIAEFPSGVIMIDSDRLLDYRASNLVWTYIYVTVMGWFI